MHARLKPGFTLLEVLVAMTIFSIMLLLLAQVMGGATSLWQQSRARQQKFREATQAMETLRLNIAQATLNTYYEYLAANGNPRQAGNNSFVPSTYGPISELRFIAGQGLVTDPPNAVSSAIFFQAPTGAVETAVNRPLSSLLATYGYYVAVNSDATSRPVAIQPINNSPARVRFRLMQMIEPAERLTVYTTTRLDRNTTERTWFTTPLPVAAYRSVLAENVVAMVLRVRDPAAATLSYAYESAQVASPSRRHLLPPTIDITLVAIDEASAARFAQANSAAGMITKLGLNTLFTNITKYDDDLKTLTTNLVDNKLDYRVFATSVNIEGAKWSSP